MGRPKRAVYLGIKRRTERRIARWSNELGGTLSKLWVLIKDESAYFYLVFVMRPCCKACCNTVLDGSAFCSPACERRTLPETRHHGKKLVYAGTANALKD